MQRNEKCEKFVSMSLLISFGELFPIIGQCRALLSAIIYHYNLAFIIVPVLLKGTIKTFDNLTQHLSFGFRYEGMREMRELVLSILEYQRNRVNTIISFKLL